MKNTKEREIELHKFLSKEYIDKRFATEYSRRYHDHLNKEIISFLPSNNDAKILDCGCGTGVLLKKLDELYNFTCGLDISYDMLKSIYIIKKQNLVIGDAENLPFSKGSFDIVVCRGSLHHVPSPQKALAEIYKSLKKGGSLVLSEPCIDSITIRFIRGILYKNPDKFGESHKAFISTDLEKILKDCGFSVVKIKPFGYFAYPLCGFPDFIPLLNYVPFSKHITKFLISFDDFLSHTPIIKKSGWQVVILARK